MKEIIQKVKNMSILLCYTLWWVYYFIFKNNKIGYYNNFIRSYVRASNDIFKEQIK